MSVLPERFGRNVAASYLWTATSAALALVMTPVLARGLGPQDYGIWVLVGSLIFYMELLEFGFGTATIKYVAESRAVDDREGLLKTIATSFWILAAPGVVGVLIGVALALTFGTIFGLSGDTATAAGILALLVATDIAVSIPGDTFGGTLVGLQRIDLVYWTLIAVAVAQAIGWAVVIAAGGGLVALGLVTVGLSLLGQLARFLLVRRLVPGVTVSPRRFDRGRVRRLAGLSAWFALAESSVVAIVRLDTVVVGLVVGVPEAGIYAVGQKLALAVTRLIAPSVETLFPYSAELIARQDLETLRRALLTGIRISLAIAGPLCLGLILLAEPAVRTWVGDEFADAGRVVVFLAAAGAVTAFTRTGIFVLQGMGRAKPLGILFAGEAALNLGLSIVLAIAMGIEGVALATLIAAATFHLGVFVPYLCRTFALQPLALLGSVARAHGPAAAVAVGVGIVVTNADVNGVGPLAAAGAAVVTTYLAAFAVTGLDRLERRRLAAALVRR